MRFGDSLFSVPGITECVVHKHDQFQNASEAFFLSAFHPAYGSLPAGVLPEQDPDGECGSGAGAGVT